MTKDNASTEIEHSSEIVMILEDTGDVREMLVAEFEALLDSVHGNPNYKEKSLRAVYILVNQDLNIRAAVFFLIDFDHEGKVVESWSIPLRGMLNNALPGPDLGAGVIKVVSKKQLPEQYNNYKMQLWEPLNEVERNHFVQLDSLVKRDKLGLSIYRQVSIAQEVDKVLQENVIQQKVLAVIKDQQALIDKLEKQLKSAADQQLQLGEERINYSNSLEYLEKQLENTTRKLTSSQSALQKKQKELKALELITDKFEILKKEHNLLLNVKKELEHNLKFSEEKRRLTQEELSKFKKEAKQEPLKMVEELAMQGVVFVAYHPGAGHLTIPLYQITEYHNNPELYVATSCDVSVGVYKEWLKHYQNPTCDALVENNKACGSKLQLVTKPKEFESGRSNRCNLHLNK